MKLNPDTVMLINLLFRIFLIIYLLKESDVEKTNNVKPLKYWMDPLSKRVFLIFINGLQADFFKQNSTPYLRNMAENFGAFGVALTGYMQTNTEGLRTVLTGRYSPPFPFSWLVRPCKESILDYVGYKCAIGNIPEDLATMCYIPDDSPLENFQKLPRLFRKEQYKSRLYIMSLNLDPIWVKDYPARLKKIDDDIRFFASVIDSVFVDNKTTYIVTSARGSPVGKSLSIDAPVIAWGSGIANYNHITYMWQSDLTAMLCALLGINFPSRLFGVIPMNMMDLEEYYTFELGLYTIRHYEKVLEMVDLQGYMVESSELQMDQVGTRLNHVVFELRRSKILRMMYNSCFLILLLTLWGVLVLLFSSSGSAYFFCHLKSFFVLLLAVCATLSYFPLKPELLILSELVLLWIYQNSGQVCDLVSRHGIVICVAVVLTFVGVTLVGVLGSKIAVPCLLAPLVLWPVINGTYRRLHHYVLFTHLMSGVTLGVLPFARVLGDRPDLFFITSVSLLFLNNFYTLLRIFNRDFDVYMKINFFMISVTNASIILHSLSPIAWLEQVLPYFLLVFSLLSVCCTSGTLVSRLLKVLLSLFVPFLMLTVKIECVFCLSVVFHVFTWIFIEYHSIHFVELQFFLPIFSVEPKSSLKRVQFSGEDNRHIVFFVIYCYLCYFAIGHFPDLHSYDLYVVPTFVYGYPIMVSYLLAALKFFLPFFVVTLSLITVCVLKQKDFNPMVMVSVWLSDVVGCFIVFYSQFFNLAFERVVLPVRYSYFFIQQFASVSVILSYFIGKELLLGSQETFLRRLFRERKLEQ